MPKSVQIASAVAYAASHEACAAHAKTRLAAPLRSFAAPLRSPTVFLRVQHMASCADRLEVLASVSTPLARSMHRESVQLKRRLSARTEDSLPLNEIERGGFQAQAFCAARPANPAHASVTHVRQIHRPFAVGRSLLPLAHSTEQQSALISLAC